MLDTVTSLTGASEGGGAHDDPHGAREEGGVLTKMGHEGMRAELAHIEVDASMPRTPSCRPYDTYANLIATRGEERAVVHRRGKRKSRQIV